ncbi:hypothetical protein Syun_013283 [Stephania yunnanensis]|uniref:Uncharacterized protein n=1 Tax=Stephania yunnanensis TaxID=152371 RepID=A0AAP0K2G9_9MAGN
MQSTFSVLTNHDMLHWTTSVRSSASLPRATVVNQGQSSSDLWRSVYLAAVLEYLAAEVFVAAAYKKGMEWKASKMLLPYKQLCSEKKETDRLRQVIEKEMLKVEKRSNLKGRDEGVFGSREKKRGNEVTERFLHVAKT